MTAMLKATNEFRWYIRKTGIHGQIHRELQQLFTRSDGHSEWRTVPTFQEI